MRKKRHSKKELSLSKIVIIFIICTTTISVGYSLLSEELSIEGTANIIAEEVSDNNFNTDSLELTYDTNSWSSSSKTYFQYDFTLTNIGLEEIDNWKIIIDIPEDTEFVNGWSAEYEISDSKLIIIPVSYNNTISAGNYVTFGIQISTSNSQFTINKININGDVLGTENDNNNDPNSSSNAATNKNLDVVFQKGNTWGDKGEYYIQYSIFVTNNSDENINPWSFKFKLPEGGSILHLWNCNYVDAEGIVTITPTSSNQNLTTGSKTELGIQIQSPTLDFTLEKLQEDS